MFIHFICILTVERNIFGSWFDLVLYITVSTQSVIARATLDSVYMYSLVTFSPCGSQRWIPNITYWSKCVLQRSDTTVTNITGTDIFKGKLVQESKCEWSVDQSMSNPLSSEAKTKKNSRRVLCLFWLIARRVFCFFVSIFCTFF